VERLVRLLKQQRLLKKDNTAFTNYL